MTNCSSEQANTQPALLSERTDSLCDTALDAGAVCCSSLSLNQVEQDLRGLASTSSQCFAVRQRIQCAEACDPERTRWWDPTAGVAHLCDSLCKQLYSFCYTDDDSDGRTLSYPNRDVAEFCATHTGVNRSDTNACLGSLSTGTTPTVTVLTTITNADLFAGPVSAPTVSPGALSASPSPPTEEADGPGSIIAVVVVLVVLAIVCGGCWVWNNKARRERPRAQPVPPPPRVVVPNKPQPSAAPVARESEPATAVVAGSRRLASADDDSACTMGSATSVDAAIAHHTAVVAGTAAARARAAEERAAAAEARAAEAEARVGALEELARQGAPPGAVREEAEAPPRYTAGNSGGSCTEAAAAAAAATAEERRRAAAEGRRAAAQRRADAAGSRELRAMQAEGGGARGASSSCGNAQAGSGAEADGGGKWDQARRGGKVERGERGERQPGRLRRQVSHTVSKIGSRVQTQQMAQEDARKQEARLQKAKKEAARRIKIWQQKHRDIYSLLESLRGFGPPLFPKDPLGDATLERNARSLRKAYHKCAARLHPDKMQGESVQVRALAEELFKALGEAYAAETGRLEAVDNALSA